MPIQKRRPGARTTELGKRRGGRAAAHLTSEVIDRAKARGVSALALHDKARAAGDRLLDINRQLIAVEKLLAQLGEADEQLIDDLWRKRCDLGAEMFVCSVHIFLSALDGIGGLVRSRRERRNARFRAEAPDEITEATWLALWAGHENDGKPVSSYAIAEAFGVEGDEVRDSRERRAADRWFDEQRDHARKLIEQGRKHLARIDAAIADSKSDPGLTEVIRATRNALAGKIEWAKTAIRQS